MFTFEIESVLISFIYLTRRRGRDGKKDNGGNNRKLYFHNTCIPNIFFPEYITVQDKGQ